MNWQTSSGFTQVGKWDPVLGINLYNGAILWPGGGNQIPDGTPFSGMLATAFMCSTLIGDLFQNALQDTMELET